MWLNRSIQILRFFALTVLLLTITRCMPPGEGETIPFEYDLGRQDVREIFNYQAMGKVDSVRVFLTDPDPTMRYTAALCLASTKDVQALEQLHNLLNDSALAVAEMAAYTVGQVGKNESVLPLTNAFRSDVQNRKYDLFNARILEAVGKCGGPRELELLSSISTYRASDTLLVLGQVRGIYRLMLKGVTSQTATDAIAGIMLNPSMAAPVRTLCSNYFYRHRQADISNYTYSFTKLLQEEEDPNIRMGIATAMARNANGRGIAGILSMLDREQDARVQVNYLRGLNENKNVLAQSFILENLAGWDESVQVVASNYLIDHGSEDGSFALFDLAKSGKFSPQVEANLLAAALVHLPFYYSVSRNAASRHMIQKSSSSEDPYAKWAYWYGLSYSPENIDWLIGEWENIKEPILKTGLVNAYLNSLEHIDQPYISVTGQRAYKEKVIRTLIAGIKTGDAGAVAAAAAGLTSKFDDLKTFLPESSELKTVLEILKLPDELESYNALEELISKIEGRVPVPKESSNFREIRWEWISKTTANTRAVIKTEAGDISIKLIPDHTPHSVANFMDLANRGFFSNKTFHRVVPNFVIQDGCPRGDGYGSLDYNVRSELGPNYYHNTGMVGMASAGMHTEGTQWFITHSPTPHLDGRYSLFGKVTDGLDILQKIRQGDKIKSIEIKNLNE